MGECQKSLKIKIYIVFSSWPVADMLIDSKNQVRALVACDQTCLCRNAFFSLDLVFSDNISEKACFSLWLSKEKSSVRV